ncbi:DNA gyrase inhibitor YacG [Paraurantiacibacter namhicola]|uniref:DNA gyrase inhibitor YacG n=1 Tax=Paraurantiacibacter namhicola TaxID=645517 RepID=A0A1C7D7L2_9SPHN|nr:DNA gyrase inhibitor YacG [Paraurantiacibacter namhicola]ANU07435.1 zinc-binding protein [Paraurantiacibacter namhicola]
MTTAKTKPCPICKKPRTEEFAPFCSSRCRDLDLAKWFGDGYAVPGPAARPEDLVAPGEDGE